MEARYQREDVRILLLGEDGVGKTSLIMALVTEDFPQQVPAKAEEITIPADITQEKIPTHIVDFSFAEQSQEDLFEEIEKASVICLVYSVDMPQSVEKLKSYWLPLLSKRLAPEEGEAVAGHFAVGHRGRKPVVVVGNKSDLHAESSLQEIVPMMDEYSCIESCVECSAKTLRNISEVFYYAQKSVLYPTSQLYDAQEKEITAACRKAFTRVFKICDLDNDGVLCDLELNKFQQTCFNAPLPPQSLEDVRNLVSKNITDGLDQNQGLTLKGFLYLQTMFIQRGKIENSWVVLRKFGYDDDLQLHHSYLYPPLKVPEGCSTELTSHGEDFLSSLFQKFDMDKDGCLSPDELRDLFGTCPLVPWGADVNNTVLTNEKGWITLKGYLAQWALTTLLDVSRTMEYLAYMGYVTDEENQLSAIHVTREKRLDEEKKQSSRTVFKCNVVGDKASGKTTFIQGFLNKTLQEQKEIWEPDVPAYTVNSVQVYGQDRHLVLHEIDCSVHGGESSDEMQCDVVCLLFHDTKSLQFCENIYQECLAARRTPCLLVRTRADETQVEIETAASEFCTRFKLPAVQKFTADKEISKDIYVKLATMAAFPNLKRLVHMLLTTPGTYWITDKLRNLDGATLAAAGVGVAAVAFLGIAAFKYLPSR